MRWIAVSLLAINLLVFIFQFVQAGGRETIPPVAVHSDPGSQGRSIRLLAELSDESVKQMKMVRQTVKPAGEVAPAAGEALCTLVGPYDALLQAEYLIERLAALDVQARIQELEIPGEIGYWVYLPPRETRRQAFNELRELQAKGIDSYVIPKGELANGISFGMFSQAALAQNRMEDMRSRGYAAEIKETPRIYRETWVVVPPGQAGYVDNPMWESLLQGADNVERRQNFCPPVAS